MYSQQWIRHHLSMAVKMLDSLPKHFKDVLKMTKEDQEPWMTAMKEEIKFLHEREVWDFVDLPKGHQIIKGVMDIWDPPLFSSIPPSPPFHTLWDMITNDKGISAEIWDQFVDGNVLSMPSERLSPPPLFPFHFISFRTYLYSCQHDYSPHHFLSSCLHSSISMNDSSPPPHNHAYFYMSFLLILIDIASLATLSLCIAL